MQQLPNVLIALFVAMSPLSTFPIFLSLTDGLPSDEARRHLLAGLITGLSVASVMIFGGQPLFRYMGVLVDDLRIGGGLILLVLAIYDLVFSREQRKTEQGQTNSDFGVVPLGTPLIVGPATMTACITLSETYGPIVTFVGIAVLITLVGLFFFFGRRLAEYIKPSITRAIGKVMALILAAFAVAMIRTGIQNAFLGG
jgi:multiple antibiotic resistance protein